MSDRKRKERGFTLIELMLVIVILGILAGVAVNSFTGMSEDARKARAHADIQVVVNAIKLYELETGQFPPEDEWVTELTTKTEEHRSYLEKRPTDPWGEEYNYREESENGLDFPDVWSNGPDKQEGTDDDIGNWDVEGLEDESEI